MNRLLSTFRSEESLAGLALVLLIGPFLAGCQPHQPRTPSEGAPADSLAEGYQWLENRYQEMGEAMPPAMRGMRNQMRAMHGDMMDGRDSARGGMMGRMRGRMQGKMGRMKDRMRHRGGEGASRDTSRGRFAMGPRDMSAMHETMAQRMEERRPEMASRHRRMARWHQQMMGAEDSDETGQALDEARSGEALFTRQCASCHGQRGEGVSGAFPPLAGSEWVTGDVSVPARIVLHGLEGPIAVGEQRYNGVMPAFGDRLSDAKVARLLTFLRTSLTEEGTPVQPEEVARIRKAYSDRSDPWTAEELREAQSSGEEAR